MIWLLVALAIYVGILFGIAWASLHPFRTPLFISPSSLGLMQEEITIPSSDGVELAAWWVPSASQNEATVAILCHGYVMNRSELTPVAYWLHRRGVSCLLFEFRAHGHTRGGASSVGYREAEDVMAVVAEAKRRIPGARILVIGSSMGSAAAAFAAGRGAPIDALVLDSCYSTLASASIGWWRFLGGRLLSWLLAPTMLIAGPLVGVNPFRVDVAHALAQVRIPILMLHGRCDTLALPSQAKRNLKAAPHSEIVWFENCGHSEFRWIQADAYYAALEAFLVRQNLINSSSASPPESPIG